MTIRFFCALLAALVPALAPIAAADEPAAKVNGRTITIEELKKTINSTPWALPRGGAATGSQKKLVIEVLGGMIDSELLYDDAVKQGIPASAEFTAEMNAYQRSHLARLYRQKILDAVSPGSGEVAAFAKEKMVNPETAKALLTKERRRTAIEKESARLFDEFAVKYVPTVATTEVSSLADDDILVSSKTFSIYFRDIKKPLAESGNSKNVLMDILAQTVEESLFAAAALAGGLDKAPEFSEEAAANSRVLAVVIHRRNLEKRFAPSGREISTFIKRNGYLAYKPQVASVLLIVVPSRTEAEALRQRALKGESFYALATEHSIAPNAGVNAGRIEPITIGDHPYSSIDLTLMKMKPDEITAPIKGDKGYSIFKLLAITPREKRGSDELKEMASRLIVEGRMLKYLEQLRKEKEIIIYPSVNDL